MPRDPRHGSLAASDAKILHARWVRLAANMTLGVASDHLTAWKLVVDSRLIPIYSPTLLRAALEGAVLCRRPGPELRLILTVA